MSRRSVEAGFVPRIAFVSAEAFYLDVPAGERRCGLGKRFCIHHDARGLETRGLVLYVHPFAEEMNKARRMAALQSRALAEMGFSVLQIDLQGCGDSSGDFGDATWQGWIDDVLLGCRWLQRRAEAPLWLWGLRAGCLLSCDAARRLATPCHFLFWQPTIRGKSALQQFFRLKVAADMVTGDSTGVIERIRRQLDSGAGVEIAGYALSPELAKGLDEALVNPPPGGRGRVVWLEVSAAADATLTAASEEAIERWKRAGYVVHYDVVAGPAFWQTTEIEEAPKLLTITADALLGTVAI